MANALLLESLENLHMTDRDKSESARRTEGEGVPSPNAGAPDAGIDGKERNRRDQPREKAEPQRRKPPKARKH